MSKPDPFLIEPPDGVMYRWVVTHVMGKPVGNLGKTFDDLEDALCSGWRLVPEDRHPEFAFPHGPGGCVLLERPRTETDAAIAELADRSRARDARMKAVLHSGSNLELPPGFRAVTGEDLADRGLIATARGWVTMEFYRSQERANGTNPLDGE